MQEVIETTNNTTGTIEGYPNCNIFQYGNSYARASWTKGWGECRAFTISLKEALLGLPIERRESDLHSLSTLGPIDHPRIASTQEPSAPEEDIAKVEWATAMPKT